MQTFDLSSIERMVNAITSPCVPTIELVLSAESPAIHDCTPEFVRVFVAVRVAVAFSTPST